MSLTPAQRILKLRKELTDHSFRYYVLNSPSIADYEYDKLFKELLELEKQHPEMGDPNSPTLRVGSPVPANLLKVRHKVRMLSLDNIESLEDTLRFFQKYRGHEATIEMKIDGLSLHNSYKKGKLVQAITRGDGSEGQDVTENARTIRTLPLELRKPVDIEVRGEAHWRISAYNAYHATNPKKRYANRRNGASGIMQQKDSREAAKCRLDFVAYAVTSDVPAAIETQEGMLDYLESLGFRTPMTLDVTRDMAGLPFLTTVIEPNTLLEAIEFMRDYRQALDLDTDGLVFKISNLALQRDIGEGERSPRWAAAYKFPPEVKETKLLGVTVQIGRSGQVAPVAELEPVSVGGVTVQRASLHNQQEIDRLHIDIGDYILIQRGGEVIPDVIGLSRPLPGKKNPTKSYQLPVVCPSCNSELVRFEGQVHQYCLNSKLCPARILAQLTYSLSEDGLDFDGCGESTVKTLIELGGVRQLSDLFALKDFSFLKPAQKKKVEEGIERAKTLPLWRKISALGIDQIGKVRAQDLSAKFDSLMDMYKDKEGTVAIVKEVAADSLRRWVEDYIDEMERLADHGFILREDKKNAGILSGKAFVITGKMLSGARDEVSALIEQHGGIVKGAVTQKVQYLVQGTGGGNNKAAGASKWGTEVISEQQLYGMIGIPMPIRARNFSENDLA